MTMRAGQIEKATHSAQFLCDELRELLRDATTIEAHVLDQQIEATVATMRVLAMMAADDMRIKKTVRACGGLDGWRPDLLVLQADRYHYAVVDRDGAMWDVCPTRFGAMRRLRRHERLRPGAMNLHPEQPLIVPLGPGELRGLLLARARLDAIGDTFGAVVARAASAGVRARWPARTRGLGAAADA